MKKSIAILIGLAIILGAFAAYFFFRSKPAAVAINPATGLPFGSGDGYDVNGNPIGSTSTGTSGTPVGNGVLPKLFKLSDAPVAGATSILKNNTEIVRYADRATGHIYDVNPATLEKVEIANGTPSTVYEALWSANGSAVIFRSLQGSTDTIVNLSLALVAPKATSTDLYTVTTSTVHGSLGDMLPTGDGMLAFISNDQSAVETSEFSGLKPAILFRTPFTDWRISGASKGALALTTKASAGVDGFSYTASRASGALTKLLGPLPGLIAVANSDLSRLVFSISDGANTTLTAMVLKNGDSEALAPATLAEKCVWSAKHANTLYCASPTGGVGENEPDLWYQGKAHFSDRLWKFDADSGAAVLLADPANDFKTPIDAEDLVLSPDEDYLIFMNKDDLSLWALKLN